MKNFFQVSFLSLVLLTGCSTFNSQNYEYVAVEQPGIDKETMAKMYRPFSHTPERTPSGEIVSKPRYFWEADSLKIPLTAAAKINSVYTVKFNQYSVYEMKERVLKTVAEVEERWQQGQNSVLVCNEQEGSGKSEYWNNFYSAPASKKADALAKAIDGIGDVSAASLVKKQYFQSKPRNWEDFESEIHRASAAGVITKSVEYQVLYKYRSENYTKLGYNTQLGNVCRLEIQTYYYPTEVVVNRQIYVDEVRTQRDLISTENRSYAIQISGQKLQSFETEMLVFTFDHDTNQFSLAPSDYNNYSLSTEGGKIIVKGLSRKNIGLPWDALPMGATLEASGGMAKFTAPVNKLYIPKSAADGHLLVSVRVYSCKKGMFGGCAVFKKDEKIQETVVKDIQSALVTHQFNITPGRKYWVQYWVNTANSPWYSNNVVQASSSPEL